LLGNPISFSLKEVFTDSESESESESEPETDGKLCGKKERKEEIETLLRNYVLDNFNPQCRKDTRIGKGGYGSVYKETHPKGELWAVKRLSKHGQRFKRKCDILGDIVTSARLMQEVITNKTLFSYILTS
jgi:hypothetical protein